MLGIRCPDRHALPLTHSPPLPKTRRPRRTASRMSGFVLGVGADVALRLLMGSNEAALVAAFLLG